MSNSQLTSEITLETIKGYTEGWKHTPLDTKRHLLNNGSGFFIKLEDYEVIKKQPLGSNAAKEYINLYFGVEVVEVINNEKVVNKKDKLFAYLINDVYDESLASKEETTPIKNLLRVEMRHSSSGTVLPTPPILTSNGTDVNSDDYFKRLNRILKLSTLISEEAYPNYLHSSAFAAQAAYLMRNGRIDYEKLKDLENELDELLEAKKIVARSFNWKTHSDKWAPTNCEKQVQVFTIPIIDFDRAFGLNITNTGDDAKEVCIFFGLKNYKQQKIDGTLHGPFENEVEALLCARSPEPRMPKSEEDFFNTFLFGDITTPYPPFSIAQNRFNLLST